MPDIIKQYKLTKTSRNSQIKRYGVLLICLATRAVHLLLSIDMATDRFLMTLRRFIARRGEPNAVRCNKRSNFVGVEIDKLYTILTMISWQNNYHYKVQVEST